MRVAFGPILALTLVLAWTTTVTITACAAATSTAHPFTAEPAPDQLQLAWLDADGVLQAVVLDARATTGVATPVDAGAAAHVVPLGSLWKLAAYARLIEAGVADGGYTCRGQDPEEVYCCDPGDRIDRATALWRSCGRYFETQDGLDTVAPVPDGAWATRPVALRSPDTVPAPESAAFPALVPTPGPASARVPVPAAIPARSALPSPATRVPLGDWLRWLDAWPKALRDRANGDLLGYWLQGPGRGALAAVGSRLRLKTFTVDSVRPGERWAGASGWLDGVTPIWLAARGASAAVLAQWSEPAVAQLDARLATTPARASAATDAQAEPCVDVHFFERYPVRTLAPLPDAEGVLAAGHYRLTFASGTTLAVESRRELSWRRDGDAIVVSGRLRLEDYVARVIDREGSGRPAAAGQALAVAARTYLLAHAQAREGCLAIADSSATQRVAPRPASMAAREAARFTRGLVLDGSVGQYRNTTDEAGLLSWQKAVADAEGGAGFDAILRDAYPGAALAAAAGSGSTSACRTLPAAEQWLRARQPDWHRQLLGLAGYRRPVDVQVCRLAAGRPHAVREMRRIYARGAQSLDERLTLAHEYLHLAFSGHPRGHDEVFVEDRARRLLGVD